MTVFDKINECPWWIIDQVSKSIQVSINKNKSLNITLILHNSPLKKMHSLILPYAGPKRNTIIKTMNNSLKRFLPYNAKTGVTYTGQKLRTKFQSKDKTEDQRKHDLVYYSKCPEPT